MIDFKILDTLVNSGAFLAINENTMTITVGTEESNYIDDDSENEFHRLDVFVPATYFPLGDNLFNFLAISPEDLRLLYTLAENTKYWNGEYPAGSVRDFLLSLNCIYLYLLYYSFQREHLGDQYRSRLDHISKEFEFALNFCCNDSFNVYLNQLTAQQRYYIYCQLYVDNSLTIDRHYEERNLLFLESESRIDLLDQTSRKGRELSDRKHSEEWEPVTDVPDLKEIVNTIKNIPVHTAYRYQCGQLKEYLLRELLALIKLDIRVKKCQNCGKYFILKGDYATEYCDRIPEGEKFTCKKVAAIKARKTKVNNNPILKEYQKAYKRMFARVSNKKITPEDFRIWSEESARKRDQITELYKECPSEEMLREFKEYLGNK